VACHVLTASSGREGLEVFASNAIVVAEVFQNYFADLQAALIIVDTQESFLPPGHVKLLAPRPKLGRIALRRVPLSARQRRASRGGFFLRPLALEVHPKTRDFICLVFHYMHILSTAP
jgi:hypothetical protein